MLYNLNNIYKIFYNNKEYSSICSNNKLIFTNEIKKKYYYTKDSSYINFFSEDFKRKGSIKLPDVLSGCTIEYDFIYNCFVGYKTSYQYFTIVYFTIDILNKTLNISMQIRQLGIKPPNGTYSSMCYIPGGLLKFFGRYKSSDSLNRYSFYYLYKLFNPYNSENIEILKKTGYGERAIDYKDTFISSLNIEKNTNKLVISTYGTNFSYSPFEQLYLRLIVNKNGNKIKVECKEDEDDSNYDYYWRNTNDNNISFRFDYKKRYYYNSEKKLNNYTSSGNDYIFTTHNFECRMIKNNKYYFLNNYRSVSYIDIIDYPITENKEIKSIYCNSNSCNIPIILNNEIYSSNFYDKMVKYNEETSSFDLIDNFIDFGTSTSQKFLCFI